MSEGNSTIVPLEGDLLLLNQLNLVTSTTVAGTLDGIAFTLFSLYVHSLAPRLRSGDRKRQARFMLGYSSIIMLCGLCNLIINTWVNQDAYIKHTDSPGGPAFYETTTLHTPVQIANYFCLWMVDTLTSAIQIWRVWVVWGATRYANVVIVLPSLCFLIFSALRLRTQVLQATLSRAEIIPLDTKTGQVAFALQATVTLLCTLLISLYLIFRHWQQRKLIGKAQGSSGYMGVVAILIESYALESIWLLINTITWAKVVSEFFSDPAPCIEIISYLLVQFRVAKGTAYESQRSRQNMSSLHWNHEDHITTRSGEINGRISGPPTQQEASEALPVSSLA